MTRSPVFSHVTTSLNGLTSVRAYGAEERFINEFETKLDINTNSWFYFLSVKLSAELVLTLTFFQIGLEMDRLDLGLDVCGLCGRGDSFDADQSG